MTLEVTGIHKTTNVREGLHVQKATSNQDTVTCKLTDAFIQGDCERVESILTTAEPTFIERLNSDSKTKSKIENSIRGFKDLGKIKTAASLSRLSFQYGLVYDKCENPITTRTLVYACNQLDDNETNITCAHLLADAIRCGLTFDPKMIVLTAIKSRDRYRTPENTRAYSDVVISSLERNALPYDIDALKFYATVLSTLANPKVQKNDGEKSLIELSERVKLVCKIAFLILDKQVPLNKDLNLPTNRDGVPTHLRMDALIQDLRVIAKKLHGLNEYLRVALGHYTDTSKQGILTRVRDEILEPNGQLQLHELEDIDLEQASNFDARKEGDIVLENALRILKRTIKSYPIEAVTINSTIAAINKINLPLTKALCDVIKNIIRESLEKPKMKEGILPDSIDCLLRVLVSIGTEDVTPTAIEIAVIASEHGIVLTPLTLTRIFEGTENMQLRLDQQEKRSKLPGLINKAIKVHGFQQTTRNNKNNLRGGLETLKETRSMRI